LELEKDAVIVQVRASSMSHPDSSTTPTSPRPAFRWLVESAWFAAMSTAVGAVSALFLTSLDEVTALRFQFPWLLYLLPVAGVLMVWAYRRHGGRAEGGSVLLFEAIRSPAPPSAEPGAAVPRRMAPFIFFATLLTHLCGGSAGREGAAVQMGGGMAAAVCRWAGASERFARLLLMGGVAAGFGALFGTPLAGAVFALEVLRPGRLPWRALLPCLAAGFLGDLACGFCGATHVPLRITFQSGSTFWGVLGAMDFSLLGKVVFAALCFGAIGRLFVFCAHGLSGLLARWVPSPLWRVSLGGGVVVALCVVLGTRDYLGLGASSADPGAMVIPAFFSEAPASPWAWGWKMVFTLVTICSGFKGGEVTPLFFIGAAAGHALAVVMGVPVDLLAGLGFLAVFGSASKTPLACALMGVEIFGPTHGLLMLVVCLLASAVSGGAGLYRRPHALADDADGRPATAENPPVLRAE